MLCIYTRSLDSQQFYARYWTPTITGEKVCGILESETACKFNEAVLRLAFFLAKLWDGMEVWCWNVFLGYNDRNHETLSYPRVIPVGTYFGNIFKAIRQKRSF